MHARIDWSASGSKFLSSAYNLTALVIPENESCDACRKERKCKSADKNVYVERKNRRQKEESRAKIRDDEDNGREMKVARKNRLQYNNEGKGGLLTAVQTTAQESLATLLPVV